ETKFVENGVSVGGGSILGVLGGIGRVLMQGTFKGAIFIPGKYTGTFMPRSEVQGIYFASHFDNYYVNAPTDDVLRLLEDLALWGQNSVAVWFDLHHYSGPNDPEAIKMATRLNTYLKYAKKLGMIIKHGGLANEGFNTTPNEVRAEWHVQGNYKRSPGSHYHTEICPNKIGGLELIIKNRRKMLELFQECPPDIFSLSVYDQGGCTCSACEPYGGNSYPKILKALLPTFKSFNPDIKLMLSGWYLDRFIDGEWEMLYESFSQSKELNSNYQYIGGISTLNENKPPLRALLGDGPMGTKVLGFPEISMQGCYPYGGFGANPMPQVLQHEWDKTGKNQAGMFAYSEGIFEDINKFIVIGMYSGKFSNTRDAVRTYVKMELSSDYCDKLTDVLFDMEQTYRRKVPLEIIDNRDGYQVYNDIRLRITFDNPEKIESIFQTVAQIDSKLPSYIRNSFRWRLIYNRAAADYTLLLHDGYMNEETEQYLWDLWHLYHITDNSYLCVTPPVRACVFKQFPGRNKGRTDAQSEFAINLI
ncbi:MAG: hypothetical protein PHG58_10440, partial [Clostridia bacterium]|nr:hypothetical protein [Clostridia bacterium]